MPSGEHLKGKRPANAFKSKAELGGKIDPRINVKGRPKSGDDLRRLFQELAGEVVSIEIGKGKNKKTVKMTRAQSIGIQMAANQKNQETFLAYAYGKPRADGGFASDSLEAGHFSIPAYLIGKQFLEPYRDIREERHTEYVFHGGRGSLKSSFISLVFVELLVNNPTMHGLVMRQVNNTLRNSVYSQITWAISQLGLEDKFKMTVSPMEMEYLPTGQRIFFRGADEPGKLKSLKPSFGYIGLLWFEELDQYHGAEAIRNIEQSAIRGGDKAFIFKSFNAPRTAANWANKYVKIPKESQLVHFSNYLDVPKEWLGLVFLQEAEHLHDVNPMAWEHEYGGVANGTGGLLFENCKLQPITDAQIAQFDRPLQGNDWGFFPDPFHYNKMHYDAARRMLYIYGELRLYRTGNRAAYDELVRTGLLDNNHLLIADSAEPKSVSDFREYGANIRSAEKGPDSVNYSMKWLQSLTGIIIDPKRCPLTAEEFLNYELEKDKDGEFITAYPDKNDHGIAAVRYATNLLWRARGQ